MRHSFILGFINTVAVKLYLHMHSSFNLLESSTPIFPSLTKNQQLRYINLYHQQQQPHSNNAGSFLPAKAINLLSELQILDSCNSCTEGIDYTNNVLIFMLNFSVSEENENTS